MKNKVIKVISLLTALVTLFSFAACNGNGGNETTSATDKDVAATEVVTDEAGEAVTDEKGEAETITVEDETVEDETTKKADDKSTTKKDDKTTTKKDGKTTTKKNDKTTTKKDDKTTTKTTKPSTTKPTTKPTTNKKTFSKAEIVDIVTKAINKAKDKSPGYTKDKYQKLEGSAEGIPSVLISAFEEENKKTYAPGKADVNSFGVDGYVKTKASDLESATIKESNGKYIINYTFGKEKNPADLNSKYGRTMDIMSRDEVLDIGGFLIKEVSMDYYGGFLKIEIDKATGNIVYMQMGSSVDASVQLLVGKPFVAKNIRSIATYTDFKW